MSVYHKQVLKSYKPGETWIKIGTRGEKQKDWILYFFGIGADFMIQLFRICPFLIVRSEFELKEHGVKDVSFDI